MAIILLTFAAKYVLHMPNKEELIAQVEAEQVAMIEKICLPPNEACSEEHMKQRVAMAPELFLVAVDKVTGKIAGLLMGFLRRRILFGMNFLQI